VQANVLGVYLDAASLEGDLTDFEARAVVVSTCDPFRPPIQVRAGRVRLVRGARLTLRNARLFVYGQPLLTLPQFTVRVGETAEVVSLPSPVYSAETGWGARARLELPLGERTLLQASAASYLRAVPEVRAAVGVALRGDEPALGDPDLRLRFEQSALYNLRVRPERTPPADALTLRAEIARDVRPLLAPRERLRVSRTELALIAPLQYMRAASARRACATGASASASTGSARLPASDSRWKATGSSRCLGAARCNCACTCGRATHAMQASATTSGCARNWSCSGSPTVR
jgi:hypothetical protein